MSGNPGYTNGRRSFSSYWDFFNDLGGGTEADESESVPVKNESEQEAKTKKHPFMCQQCGMGFRHKSSLEVHEYSHKGIVLLKDFRPIQQVTPLLHKVTIIEAFKSQVCQVNCNRAH